MKFHFFLLYLLILISSQTSKAQYCVPYSGGGNCIMNVTLDSLVNPTLGCSSTNYFIYSQTTTVNIGLTYPFFVNCNAQSKVAAWIDYNQDNLFGPSEYIVLYNNSSSGMTSFTVPLTAMLGSTRLRVRSVSTSTINFNASSACDSFFTGETEDYIIQIANASPCLGVPASASISATQNPICSGISTTLSVSPIWPFSGVNYQWERASNCNGPFINIGGATGPTLTDSPPSTRAYRCRIYCSNNMSSVISSCILVNVASSNLTTYIPLCSAQLPYTWNGNSYSNFGTYADTFLNVNGCDSIVTLNLTQSAPLVTSSNINLCSNLLPYTWNGNSYSNFGTYADTFLNVNGCDSIVVLNLTQNAPVVNNSNINLCPNQLPYTWNGNSYSNFGTYVDTFLNVNGCDSIVALNLTQTMPVVTNSNINLCSNQLPYTWNGILLTSAGTYSDTFLNVNGCDSISILTINQLPQNNTQVNILGSTIYALQANATYQWVDCNSLSTILGANNISYSPLSNGSYAVIISINGCTDTSNCVPINSLNVKSVLLHDKIVIVPNPNQGLFTISTESAGEIEITDAIGRKIMGDKILKGKTRIDLGQFSSGTYFVVFLSQNERSWIKLVIHK